MSEPDKSAALDEHPAVRDHTFVCAGALTAMVAALVLRRPDPWVLLPAFLGMLGLLFRWRAGPVILLLAVVLLLWSWSLGTDPGQLILYAVRWLRWWLISWWRGPFPQYRSGAPSRGVLPPSDLLLAASLLTYAAAQYRLQGLVGRLFPSDPRRERAAARRGKGKDNKAEESQGRSPDLVTARELVVLLPALAACAGLASLIWARLRVRETELEIADSSWQGILVLWLLGGGVLVVSALLRYLALRRMTPPEASLYLQDLLWRETRREQSRVNRWLAWAWLRRRRGEDKEPS
jgi:hypothetical protein